MSDGVAVPAWLLVLMAALALWALYEHVLAPALRFLVTHPANQVIDELGERLRIGIRPFQRTKRQALIHSLLADRKVQAAAEQFARDKGVALPAALRRVERYAREIVPAFNAYFYFRIGYLDSEGIAKIGPEATVVFVMNHRSNMDYILTAYLAADQAALSYAVGEWARIWPLSALIRAMGAYFVRRDSKDELYRRVLERYIAMATEAGVPQALFPEGGLTRDGRMREPRLGVIDYMMRGFRMEGDHDLVFVPLGINYDRVIEDRSLLRVLDPSAASVGRVKALWNALAFAARNLRLMLKSEWYRFGYACVNFGAPVSMRAYCRERGVDFQRLAGEERRRETAALGEHLMRSVGLVVPVVPVPLMATVFVRDPERRLSALELKAEVGQLIARLERSAAHVYVPRRDLDYALDVGLRMLLMRHLVEEHQGIYLAREKELPLLRYYANSIAHLLE